jgi:nucleotide-binding universal stress UspA family protein
VLVPLANPATAESLLDLALIARGHRTEEPLRVMMVVPGEGGASEAEIAEAEAVLGYAVLHAAGTNVPVVPMTRVDTSIAAGIARAAAETRTSLVVIGWDGRRSSTRAVFGTVLDQLLARTRAAVLVARLTRTPRSVRQMMVLIPRRLERHPGTRK